MAQEVRTDQCFITMGEADASVRLPDGSCSSVPRAVISRSSVLRTAIDTARTGVEVSVAFPKGMLSRWLQCISALSASSSRICASSSGICTVLAMDVRLLDFLKAADYMDDQEAVKHLCQHTAHWLFDAMLHTQSRLRKRKRSKESSPSNIWLVDRHGQQGLRVLPENLQMAVLRASPISLAEQLSRLPTEFHNVAAHAAFPSIAADRCIDLSYKSIGGDVMEENVCQVLWGLLTNISSLRLSDLDIERATILTRSFAAHMGSLTGLQELDITFAAIGAQGISMFGPQIATLTNLRKLSISYTYPDRDFSLLLAPHVVQITFLHELDLTFTQNGPDFFRALALSSYKGLALSSFKNLQKLNLAYNFLDAECIELLGPHLACLTSLQRIDLSCNSFRNKGAVALGPHLSRLLLLKQLDLSMNYFDSKGAACLAPHVACLTGLSELRLSGNYLYEDNSAWLTKILCSLKSLQLLDVSSTDAICDWELKFLADHTSCLASLQHLDVSCNPVGDKGMSSLTIHFCTLTVLQFLDLSCTKISDKGVISLAHHVPSLTALQKLYLSENEISYKGATALVQQLFTLTSLMQLSLYGNKVSVKEARALVPILNQLGSLQQEPHDILGSDLDSDSDSGRYDGVLDSDTDSDPDNFIDEYNEVKETYQDPDGTDSWLELV